MLADMGSGSAAGDGSWGTWSRSLLSDGEGEGEWEVVGRGELGVDMLWVLFRSIYDGLQEL